MRASEKRALLEIDRERNSAEKLQKELDVTMKRIDRRDSDHRRAVDVLQTQLGDARHQTGVLQGRLDTVLSAYETLEEQLIALRRATESVPVKRRTDTSRGSAVGRATRRAADNKATKRRKED